MLIIVMAVMIVGNNMDTFVPKVLHLDKFLQEQSSTIGLVKVKLL